MPLMRIDGRIRYLTAKIKKLYQINLGVYIKDYQVRQKGATEARRFKTFKT